MSYDEDESGNCALHHAAVCETCAIDAATKALRIDLAEERRNASRIAAEIARWRAQRSGARNRRRLVSRRKK